MSKPYISLKPTEQTLTEAAAGIYAAYITAGRVAEGDENAWMERSIREAIKIARTVDDSVQSDGEFD